MKKSNLIHFLQRSTGIYCEKAGNFFVLAFLSFCEIFKVINRFNPSKLF